MERENFPPFLFRALKEKQFAEDFAHRGKFCLGSIDYYKKIKDPQRRDKTEKESSYLFPTENGHCHVSGSFLGPIYLLCTFGPKVDLSYIRSSKGKYIVKVNDPEQLLYDINMATPVNSAVKKIGKPILEKVSYTKNHELSIDPDSTDAIRLDYIQKPESDSPDQEYRFVFFANLQSNIEPEDHIFFDFGRRLKYIELL